MLKDLSSLPSLQRPSCGRSDNLPYAAKVSGGKSSPTLKTGLRGHLVHVAGRGPWSPAPRSLLVSSGPSLTLPFQETPGPLASLPKADQDFKMLSNGVSRPWQRQLGVGGAVGEGGPRGRPLPAPGQDVNPPPEGSGEEGAEWGFPAPSFPQHYLY